MKKLTKQTDAKLRLHQETIKALTEANLVDVRGGQVHTSFSCGANLCTTH